MQACEGYVKDGKFYPLGNIVQNPGKLRALLTILEEPEILAEAKDNTIIWAEFDRMAEESAHENYLLDNEVFRRRSSGHEPIDFSKV